MENIKLPRMYDVFNGRNLEMLRMQHARFCSNAYLNKNKLHAGYDIPVDGLFEAMLGITDERIYDFVFYNSEKQREEVWRIGFFCNKKENDEFYKDELISEPDRRIIFRIGDSNEEYILRNNSDCEYYELDRKILRDDSAKFDLALAFHRFFKTGEFKNPLRRYERERVRKYDLLSSEDKEEYRMNGYHLCSSAFLNRNNGIDGEVNYLESILNMSNDCIQGFIYKDEKSGEEMLCGVGLISPDEAFDMFEKYESDGCFDKRVIFHVCNKNAYDFDFLSDSFVFKISKDDLMSKENVYELCYALHDFFKNGLFFSNPFDRLSRGKRIYK